jgi:hypothetical protein
MVCGVVRVPKKAATVTVPSTRRIVRVVPHVTRAPLVPIAPFLSLALSTLVLGCGDGPATLELTFTNVSAPGDLRASDGTAADVMFAPGVWAVLGEGAALFEEGSLASDGLRRLAEDGDNTPLAREARSMPGVVAVGTFGATDEGTTYEESPIAPGDVVTFTIEAARGQRLAFASMFAQSNDTFLAPVGGALALFDAEGALVAGDVTASLALFDAGSEVNEEPGIGPTQAPRQTVAGEGTDESSPIAVIDGMDAMGFVYPGVAAIVEVRVARVD